MDAYAAFTEILKHGSISRAAESLGYSQSNVSHMLQVLEDELGCTLLTRGRNGVRLSAEGEQLLPYINEIANAQNRLHEKAQAMQGLLAGKVRVASFPSAANRWLPYIIQEFHAAWPLIEFDLMNGAYPEIEAWISNGSADCGFNRLPTVQPMRSRLLKEDTFYAALPPGHKYADLQSVTIEMIAAEPLIWPDDVGENEMEPIFRKYGCTPCILYTVPDIYTLMTMVEVGLGISILPELALEGRDRIIKKPLAIQESRKIGLTVCEKPSAAARAFADYVENWVRKKYR